MSDCARLASRSWQEWCRELAGLGVDAVEVREKQLADRELTRLAREARAAFARPGFVLVNSRLDVALAADADGIHLPADGAPTARVRAVCPRPFLVGRSVHSTAEAREALDEGADFVRFGPVFDTRKEGHRIEGRGLGALEDAVSAGVPVIAVGGVTATNAAELLAAGAVGVAAIGAFADPVAARELVAAVRTAARPQPSGSPR